MDSLVGLLAARRICALLVDRAGCPPLAALLRIEASIQDLCVEAILQKSKDLAIAALAIDPNLGSFEMAEQVFNEMRETQKDFIPNFQ